MHVLEEARLYATAREAIADLNFVLATTARERGQMKRVWSPQRGGCARRAGAVEAGEKVGILFGRERTGLENDEISLADAIITFPVDPAFSSLNLAQAVLLVGYEWFGIGKRGRRCRSATSIRPPAGARDASPPSSTTSRAELDAVNFYPPDKRPIMARNMRDIFQRRELTEQDVRTLRGALRALAEGAAVEKIVRFMVARTRSRPDPRRAREPCGTVDACVPRPIACRRRARRASASGRARRDAADAARRPVPAAPITSPRRW